MRVGPVELDVHLLEVSLPGNRRERLTPSEMRLLYYLMTHTERVVAHHELSTWLFGTNNPNMRVLGERGFVDFGTLLEAQREK